jgi:hypothetical protein
MAATLTAAEVAALSGVDEGRVRKEVEYGIFTRPTFDVADLVYFAMLGALGVQFGVEDRRKLHAVVAAAVGASVGRRRSAKVEITGGDRTVIASPALKASSTSSASWVSRRGDTRGRESREAGGVEVVVSRPSRQKQPRRPC